MKTILGIVSFGILLAGCAAYITPEGTYIEPLPSVVTIDPYISVEAPAYIDVRPLPPVVVVPGRNLYRYGGSYYYHHRDNWYYSDRDSGPWYRLHQRYYPPRYRR